MWRSCGVEVSLPTRNNKNIALRLCPLFIPTSITAIVMEETKSEPWEERDLYIVPTRYHASEVRKELFLTRLDRALFCMTDIYSHLDPPIQLPTYSVPQYGSMIRDEISEAYQVALIVKRRFTNVGYDVEIRWKEETKCYQIYLSLSENPDLPHSCKRAKSCP